MFIFLEALIRIELMNQSFADSCLTAWLQRHLYIIFFFLLFYYKMIKKWSGRRGSNPRPSPWQGDALSIELLPHHMIQYIWCPETGSNRRHEDFQSSALPTELSGLLYKKNGDLEGTRTLDL
jgi:hypothetical protein